MPAFMPVGTQGTVKGLTVDAIARHRRPDDPGQYLSPGAAPGRRGGRGARRSARIQRLSGPILTDSGGFQIFSLAQNAKITEEGATFRSHLDGNLFELSPERAVAIQEALGSRRGDGARTTWWRCPTSRAWCATPTERTIRWAERAAAAAQTRRDQALFAIVQGGLDAELRVECARRLAELDFPGYAVGGLSVGEEPAEMYRVLDATVPALPADRPRYLMGVGRPQDLLEAIRRGIDLFDCVLPTRNGRNALAYTDAGPVRLRNLQYRARLAAAGRPAAPARPADTAGAICGICSWPARCWGRCSSRPTT